MIIVLRLKDDSTLAQWIEKNRNGNEPRTKVVMRKLALLHAIEELIRINNGYRRAYVNALRDLYKIAQNIIGD